MSRLWHHIWSKHCRETREMQCHDRRMWHQLFEPDFASRCINLFPRVDAADWAVRLIAIQGHAWICSSPTGAIASQDGRTGRQWHYAQGEPIEPAHVERMSIEDRRLVRAADLQRELEPLIHEAERLLRIAQHCFEHDRSVPLVLLAALDLLDNTTAHARELVS